KPPATSPNTEIPEMLNEKAQPHRITPTMATNGPGILRDSLVHPRTMPNTDDETITVGQLTLDMLK
ncbi:hypothetical protein OU790_20040, partial [Ruegeria sp. NA]